MRIRAVTTAVVNATSHTNWIFVFVETDRGLTGVGEATLIGYEDAVVEAVARIESALAGQDPLGAVPLVRPGDGSQVAAAAHAGVEQALWDLRGKAYGVPVFHLLGARRAAVPVYANINRGTLDRSPEGFGARAAQAVAAGFRAVKCAPFDGYHSWESSGRTDLIDAGVARVEAIRRAVAPGTAVLVDCHWRFDVATAVEVGRRLAPSDLGWYEAPVSELSPADVLEVKERTGMRLAGAELQTTPGEFRRLLEAGALDVVMPDVKYAGGIQGLMKVDALAEAYGARVAPHNPSGPVATAASLHAAAALDTLLMLEFQFTEVEWYAELAGADFTVRDGVIPVPAGPGLGIAFNRALAAAHPYRPITHLQDQELSAWLRR